MGTTPTYSWPYPESTDPVANGAQDIEDLALAVETTVSGLPAGQILQVVSTTKSDTFSASVGGTSFTAVTGLSLTITPSSASSTILLYGSVNGAWSLGNYMPYTAFRFTRGGSAVGVGDAAGSAKRITAHSSVPGSNWIGTLNASMMYLDSPATTSATTYAIEVWNLDNSTQTIYVNKPASASTSSQYARSISTIMALEVSP